MKFVLFKTPEKLDLEKLMEIKVRFTLRLSKSNNTFTYLFIIYY